MKKITKIILSVILAGFLLGLAWGANLYHQYTKKITDPENHNYWDRISAFTLGMNLRFDKNVAVYLGDFGDDETGETCKEIMRGAYKDWETALDGKLNVEFIEDRDKADVEVKENICPGDFMSQTEDLIRKGELSGSGCLGGSTLPGFKKRGMYIGIEVQCRKASGGIMNENYLKGVYLHEAGHSLGLQYHSNNPDDVMVSATRSNFSQSDLTTINYIYSIPATIPPWLLIKAPYVLLVIIVLLIIAAYVKLKKP